jgi:hypothetical protein
MRQTAGVMGSLKSVTCSASHHPIIPALFKAQLRHSYGTPNLAPGHDPGHRELNTTRHFVRVTQAALTKILPGEEDRFGK